MRAQILDNLSVCAGQKSSGQVLKTARGRELPRGFESHTLRSVISQHIEDTPNPRFRVRGVWVCGAVLVCRAASGWSAGGLVVAVRIEGEVAEEFAGGGVDDADVQVLDQQQNVGSGVGPADADVVEPGRLGAG
jgi:hypothetical protein